MIFLPLRLLFLLLVVVVDVRIIFSRVILTSFIILIVHLFFGEAGLCMCDVSVVRGGVRGIGLICPEGWCVTTSGCLAVVTLLLWEEKENKLNVNIGRQQHKPHIT